MSVVLAGIAALFGLLVLLLAVPVGVEFRLRGIDALGGHATVRWLFGLVRLRFDVPSGSARLSGRGTVREEGREVGRDEAREEQPRPARRARGDRAWQLLRDAAFRRRVMRLAHDLLAAAHLSALRLRLRLGLGDPADTGRIWALLGPLGATLRAIGAFDVHLEPEFMEAVLDFEAQGRGRLVPLHVVALGVAFALSPAAMRAWWSAGAGRA